MHRIIMSSWKRHDGEMKYDKKELGKDVLQIYVPIVSSLIEKINKRNNYNILKDIILGQYKKNSDILSKFECYFIMSMYTS